MTTAKSLSFIPFEPTVSSSTSSSNSSSSSSTSSLLAGPSSSSSFTSNTNSVSASSNTSSTIKQVRLGPRSPSPPLLLNLNTNSTSHVHPNMNGNSSRSHLLGATTSNSLLRLTPLSNSPATSPSIQASSSSSKLKPQSNAISCRPPPSTSATQSTSNSTSIPPPLSSRLKPFSSPVRPVPASLRGNVDSIRIRPFSSPPPQSPTFSSTANSTPTPTPAPGPGDETTPRANKTLIIGPQLPTSSSKQTTHTTSQASTPAVSPNKLSQTNPPSRFVNKLHSNGKLQTKGIAKSHLNGNSYKESLYDGPILLSWPDAITVPRAAGLHNGSMACYANATLQVILHTPPVLRLVLAHDQHSCHLSARKKYCVVCALRDMTTGPHWSGKTRAYRPQIQNNLSQIKKGFSKNRQEDTHEFFRFVTDALQASALAGLPKDLPHKVKHTTWVHRIWGGKVRSRVLCLSCKKPSDTFDTFLDLSLDVTNKQQSVAGLLDGFVKEDRLDGDNKYNCENCKKKSVATKSMRIAEAPPILTLHLKRFGVSPTSWNGRLQKVNTTIQYPPVFDLANWMTEPSTESTRYKLFAVTCHHGTSMTYGHYTSYVRGPQNSWYLADDDSVSPADKKEVLHDRAAYLLSYIRIGGDDAISAPSTPRSSAIAVGEKRKLDEVDMEEKQADGFSDVNSGCGSATKMANKHELNGVRGLVNGSSNKDVGTKRMVGPHLPLGHPNAVRRIAPVLLANNGTMNEEEEEERIKIPIRVNGKNEIGHANYETYDDGNGNPDDEDDEEEEDEEEDEDEDDDDDDYIDLFDKMNDNKAHLNTPEPSAFERLLNSGSTPKPKGSGSGVINHLVNPATDTAMAVTNSPQSNQDPHLQTNTQPPSSAHGQHSHHYQTLTKKQRKKASLKLNRAVGSCRGLGPSSNARRRSGAPMPFAQGSGGVLSRSSGSGFTNKRIGKGMLGRMKSRGQ